MSRKFPRRRVGVAVAVAALASLGGLDVTLVTAHRGGPPVIAAAVAA